MLVAIIIAYVLIGLFTLGGVMDIKACIVNIEQSAGPVVLINQLLAASTNLLIALAVFVAIQMLLFVEKITLVYMPSILMALSTANTPKKAIKKEGKKKVIASKPQVGFASHVGGFDKEPAQPANRSPYAGIPSLEPCAANPSVAPPSLDMTSRPHGSDQFHSVASTIPLSPLATPTCDAQLDMPSPAQLAPVIDSPSPAPQKDQDDAALSFFRVD